MFGELPKLFDRDFVIAFFLPAAIFLIAVIGLLAGFELFPEQVLFLKNDLVKGATIVGVAAWLGGVFLLVLNYKIYRLLEGYGTYNPLRVLLPIAQKSYRRLQESITRNVEEIKAGREENDKTAVSELNAKRRVLTQYAAERFPPRENRILPTALGNIIRAFEDYPEQMYGVDATVVWVRLQAIIPKDFKDSLNAAKAHADFWINLWLLSFLLIVLYLLIAVYTFRLSMIWFFPLAVAVVFAASRSVRTAAVSWGDFVKTAYDLYLPDLRSKLQLPAPTDLNHEKELWTKFSRQVLYHRVKDAITREAPSNKSPTEATIFIKLENKL